MFKKTRNDLTTEKPSERAQNLKTIENGMEQSDVQQFAMHLNKSLFDPNIKSSLIK